MHIGTSTKYATKGLAKLSMHHCIVGLVYESHSSSQDVDFNSHPGTYNQRNLQYIFYRHPSIIADFVAASSNASLGSIVP
jgi:hypothetical protein